MNRDQIKWLVIGLAGSVVSMTIVGLAIYSVLSRASTLVDMANRPSLVDPAERKTLSFEKAREKGIAPVDGPAQWHKRAEEFRASREHPNRLWKIYSRVTPYGDLLDSLHRDKDFDAVEADLRVQFAKLSDPMAALAYGQTVRALGNLRYDEEPEESRALIERWAEERPESHFAWLVRGVQAIDYAWYWRGNGWSASVSDEGWECYRSAIQEAREYFERSHELEPADPESLRGLMNVCLASSCDRVELEKYFNRAIRVSPGNVPIYRQKLEYLKPRWHGTWSALDEFAKGIETASAEQDNPLLLLVKLDVFREMSTEREGYKDLMEREDVRRDMLAMREGIVQRWPEDVASLAELARAYLIRKRYKEARDHFEIIGNRFPWYGPYTLGEYHRARLTSHYRSWEISDKASHERQYAEWIAIDPEYAETYNNIGAKQFADGNYDLAVSAMTRAIELSPNEGHMYLEIAYAYDKMDQSEDALRAVQKGQTLKVSDKMKNEMNRLETRLKAKVDSGKL